MTFFSCKVWNRFGIKKKSVKWNSPQNKETVQSHMFPSRPPNLISPARREWTQGGVEASFQDPAPQKRSWEQGCSTQYRWQQQNHSYGYGHPSVTQEKGTPWYSHTVDYYTAAQENEAALEWWLGKRPKYTIMLKSGGGGDNKIKPIVLSLFFSGRTQSMSKLPG